MIQAPVFDKMVKGERLVKKLGAPLFDLNVTDCQEKMVSFRGKSNALKLKGIKPLTTPEQDEKLKENELCQ